MSILAGLGLEDIPDGLPDGIYPGHLYGLKFIKVKNGTEDSMVLTYKVDQPGSPFHGETHDEFKSCNETDDMRKKRFLKQRLESIGVPSSRFGTFKPEDVIGTSVEFTIKRKGEFRNVTSVKLRNASAPTQGINPAAATNQSVTSTTQQTDIAGLL